MANNTVLQLYSDFCKFLRDAESNSFYTFFQNAIQSSPATISIFEKYVDRKIDMSWLEAIEEAIVPLDYIIRNPSSFIRRDEDIIPVAQARSIGPESVRHLSQHTNMIESVENDTVMPSRILSITKEDSVDTYESRFINTLLKLTSYFLDKRMTILMKDNKVADLFDYHLDGNCKVGQDNLTYHLNVHLEAPHQEADSSTSLINADVSTMTPMQRVERLRKIFYNFNGSAFCRALHDAPAVRAPLVLTNKLRKNPYYVKAVDLWNFLNSYTKVGYTTEFVEQYRNPNGQEKNELFSIILMQYAMMKKQNQEVANVALDEEQLQGYGGGQSELSAPKVMSRAIDQLCDTFDLSVDEVRKVYEKAIRKKEKKKFAEFSKARGIFERAIILEREAARRAEIERRERYVLEMKRRMELAALDAKRLEEEQRQKEELARQEALLHTPGVEVSYRYSFRARLIQSQEPLQTFYTKFKNYLLSFKDVSCKMTWDNEIFYYGKEEFLKMNGRGIELKLFLKASYEECEELNYKVDDLAKGNPKVTYKSRYTIFNYPSLNKAMDLIKDLLEIKGSKIVSSKFVDYHEEYRTNEELLKMNPPLVKAVFVEKKKEDEIVKFLTDGGDLPNKEALPEVSEVEKTEDDTITTYRLSFTARLIVGQNPLQDYYSCVKNHILSYKNVKSSMVWAEEKFRYDKKIYLKMSCQGKTLYLFFAENPEMFVSARHTVEDMRKNGAEVEFPTRFRVRSQGGMDFALEMIDRMMNNIGVEKGEEQNIDYHMPLRTREEMLNSKPPLVRLTKAKASEKVNSFAVNVAKGTDEESEENED